MGIPRQMSVRANRPFPPRGSGLQYFEIEILRGEVSPEVPTEVGIGLCGEFVDMSYCFPGWVRSHPSAGYHGDDGHMRDSSTGVRSVETKELFAEGATVGCGIDWNNRSVYYTLNGNLVGMYKSYNNKSTYQADSCLHESC
jgi:hypothetical protein